MTRHLLASAIAVALVAIAPHAFAVQEHHAQPAGQPAVVAQPAVGQPGQTQEGIAPNAAGANATPMLVLAQGVQTPGGGCMLPMMSMMGQDGMGMMGSMMSMMGQGGTAAPGQGMAAMAAGSQPAMGAQGMGMGMGIGPGVDRIEGRIAFLRAEIGITDAQGPAWGAFAQAVRSAAAHVVAPSMPMGGAGGAVTLGQGLEAQDLALSARLDDVKSLRSSLAQLYDVLSDEQRNAAEDLIPIIVGAVITG